MSVDHKLSLFSRPSANASKNMLNGTAENSSCNGLPEPLSTRCMAHLSSSTTSSSTSDASGWVRLNVGGQIFQTTKSTVCRAEGSFLARLVQDDDELPSEKDESGAYLIDRDPQYFSPVLNYLRHGRLVINPGVSEEGVLEEADFYNLPALSQLVVERITARDSKNNVTTKHVYRVLQCHGEELTSVVSAMSDDWRLEQLIPIGLNSYSTDVQSEYLCVVSRECHDIQRESVESQDRAKLLQQKARHN